MPDALQTTCPPDMRNNRSSRLARLSQALLIAKPRKLARLIEQAAPELKEDLLSAVELVEKRRGKRFGNLSSSCKRAFLPESER